VTKKELFRLLLVTDPFVNTVNQTMRIRDQLVQLALEWQNRFGVAPSITSTLSEEAYSEFMQDKTAVQKGHDFVYKGVRYQIKSNRPSGKPGSKVTMVPKASNYDWDILIWVLYNKEYQIQEAWGWPVERYKKELGSIKRLSPKHYRRGDQYA